VETAACYDVMIATVDQLVHIDATPEEILRGEVVPLARTERDIASALDHSLVLEAVGIAHEVRSTADGGWVLAIAAVDAAAAEAVLALWAIENEAVPTPVPTPGYGRSLVGIVVAVALVAFAVFVGTMTGATWVEAGRADAGRMLGGEWWRAATALSLHAGAAHVAGNGIALGLILTAVARRLGPGLTAWAALVAGFAGNVATALLAGAGHVSLGASTAVFGALGTLSVLHLQPRRAWLTLGSGIALLGFLGTGEHADVLAHVLGFAMGALEGLLVRRIPPPRRTALQPLIAVTALTPLVVGWWVALR
jgi:membrane associated rhomboid family serine protease